jgi:hypothetical protein
MDFPFTITIAPPASTGLRVELALPTPLVFEESAATDVGSYIGPFVEQRCLGQSQGPWVVFFRPEADGSRDEVVVEYGSTYDFSALPPKAIGLPSWRANAGSGILTVTTPPGAILPNGAILINGSRSGSPAITGQIAVNPDGTGTYSLTPTTTTASNAPMQVAPVDILAPYTATIYRGDTPLYSVSVPIHPWRARWRWQSAPRPLVRTAADLVAMKAILPLDVSNAWNAVPSPGQAYGGPMSANGVAGGAPTGDSERIGFVTEPQASWALLDNSGSLQKLLTHAETDATFTFHIRDASHAPPDMVANKGIVTTPGLDSGSPRGLHTLPFTYPPVPQPQNYLITDAAHRPAMAFVPWLLTDDPYYLEEAQMEANSPLLGMDNQERSFAWMLRDVSRMAVFAPEITPAWLRPRAYWAACLDAKRVALEQQIAGVYPSWISAHKRTTAARFHLMAESSEWLDTFEDDYLMHPFGWMLWTGLFEAWRPAVEYFSTMALTMIAEPALALGWDRRYPVAYNWTIPVPAPADWAALWSAFVSSLGLNPASWPPDTLMTPGVVGYIAEKRSALAALSLGGIAGAQVAHDWLRGQMVARITPQDTSTQYKWAVTP